MGSYKWGYESVIWVISMVTLRTLLSVYRLTLLISLLITTHEPPSGTPSPEPPRHRLQEEIDGTTATVPLQLGVEGLQLYVQTQCHALGPRAREHGSLLEYYRGLNKNPYTILGVPYYYYTCTIMGPKTLF